MNEDALYNNVVLSLIKWINDFRIANMPSATYFDWDSHAQPELLPDGDLIGPAGCGLTDESQTQISVVASIGISTSGDTNLFRLRQLISMIRGQLKWGTTIPVYDADSQQVVSWMVIRTPTAITPISKAQIRSIQFYNFSALVDPGAASSLR
jgi:hypothetical protein